MSKQRVPTDQVRIPQDLSRRVSRVAAHKGLSVSKYLAEVLAPVVLQDEREMLGQIAEEQKAMEKALKAQPKK